MERRLPSSAELSMSQIAAARSTGVRPCGWRQQRQTLAPARLRPIAVVKNPETAAKVLELSSRTQFKDLLAETGANKQLLVVDYYTTWCGPCKLVAPMVEEMAADFEARGLRVAKFTCDASDDNKKFAMELTIKSLPTFRLYREGNEQHVGQVVGTKIAELRKLVEENLAAV